MTTLIRDYLITPNFATTIWAASLVYLIPLAHRKMLILRLLAASVCFLSLGLLLRLYITPIYQLGSYLLHIALCVLLFRACCSISWRDSLFGASCGFATQFFATSLTSLLVPDQMLPNYGTEAGMLIFPQATPTTIGIHAAVYLAAYWFLARRIAIGGRYGIRSSRLAISAIILLLFGSLLNGRTYNLYYGDSNPQAYQTCLIYGLLCSALYLMVQSSAQQEIQLGTRIEVGRQLRERQRRQYEQSRKNIELINQKCHALKIRLAELSRTSADPASARI